MNQLQIYIISGKLVPGARLPSVRDLAMQAKVNPNTMQKVLAELEEQKLIYTERTNGKFITQDQELILQKRRRLADETTERYLGEMRNLGFDHETILSYINQKGEDDVAC